MSGIDVRIGYPRSQRWKLWIGWPWVRFCRHQHGMPRAKFEEMELQERLIVWRMCERCGRSQYVAVKAGLPARIDDNIHEQMVATLKRQARWTLTVFRWGIHGGKS